VIGAEWGRPTTTARRNTTRSRPAPKASGAETENWQRMAGVVQRILDAPAGEARSAMNLRCPERPAAFTFRK